MKYVIKLVFALWLSCGLAAVAFANPTHLPLDANVFQVEPAAEIWLDKDGSMLAERLTSPEMANQFKPMGRTLALGFTPDTIWLKFTLLSEHDSVWWLEVGQPVLESVRLYEVRPNMAAGSPLVVPIRSMETRRPTFHIDLKANTPKELYLRLWSRTSMTSSLTLWRPEVLLPQVQKYNLISGLVLGAYLLVIAFYALFSWWTRAKIHIYYTLYVGVNFMAAFFTGAWNHTLGWPMDPAVHTTFLGISISLAMVFSALFTTEFVQSRREWPKVSKTYIYFCTFAASISIIAILNSHYREAQIYFQSLTILTIIFTTFALFYLTLAGNNRARILLIALSIFHIGIAWRFMRNIGLIEPNDFNDNAYQIGAFVHMLIMSTGIFSSYNKLRQESEKQTARADAEAALRQRQKEFLNIVAHEVKTPLSVISAAADNLQISPTTRPSDQPRIEKIIRNAEKIRLSFESYLGKEQILNSNAEHNIRPLNLSELCTHVLKDFQETHEVEISASIAPGAMITGDANLLAVAMVNLLDNALKHNPEGTPIFLTLEIDPNNEVLICVEDQGLGVLDVDLPRLFDAYFRGGNALATAGSGLGLHLVKYISEQHHGKVSAMRCDGGGMRVVLQLPLQQN
jgi:signal transduction histidine kinase